MSSLMALLLLTCLLQNQAAAVSAKTFGNRRLLPEVFPDDPSSQLMPVFLRAPQNSYASRASPAVLTCVVAHATKAAHFICHDDQVMNSTSDTQVVDEKTQLKARKITLEVTRKEVLDGIGNFNCNCYAASAQGSHSTPDVTVMQAYMRREFEQPPYSKQIAVGSQAELRCHPPKAKPPARVTHWLRNGRQIQGDPNFIHSGDGHLLIQQARMEDSANYSCVAANDANLQKTSSAAILTVFVPGQWGQWGPWGPCSQKCGRGIRKRTRTCDSPAPKNNGPGCPGISEQPKYCNQICPAVDGEWSQWQPWSSCSPDCLQFRRRECSDPRPQNGGKYCQGDKDTDSRNCTSGVCKPGGLNTMVFYGTSDVNMDEGSSNDTGKSSFAGVPTTDLTLCIGLVVAFIIFLAVVLVIVKLLKKKGNQNNSGYTLSPSGEVLSSSGSSNGGHTVFPPHAPLQHRPPSASNGRKRSLGYTPDVLAPGSGGGGDNVFFDQYVPPSTISGGSSSGQDRNSNCSNNKELLMQKAATLTTNASGDFRPISEHLYEQPMVVFPPVLKASTPTSDKTPFLATEGNHTYKNGDITPIPFRQSTSGLPQHVECMNWARVTEQGGKITLPGSGSPTNGGSVSLTVPQSALMTSSDLYVAMVSQNEYRRTLRLDHLNQTAVTPIVQFGSLKGSPLSLNKPLVLSVPHFAASADGMSVLHCSDLDSERLVEWKVVDLAKQVDSSLVHLVTEKPGAYVVVTSDTVTARTSSSGYNSLANSPLSEPLSNQFSGMLAMPKLTSSTRAAICRSLDVPTCQGADWRRLASALGVDQYCSFFSSQPSPSEALMDLWEAKTRSATSGGNENQHVNLRNFANLLREISREDVVVILERELK